MVIDFTVENFKSIKEEQTFSMLASDSKTEIPDNVFPTEKEGNISLLKTGVILGANASGKSNLIKAIETFRDFAVNSTDLEVNQEIPYYEPYRLDENWLKKPTAFEMEFIGRNRLRYKYKVIFDRKEVLVEELVFYPQKQEARLYLRERGKAVKFGSQFKGRKRSIENELLPNHLFLTGAADSEHEQLSDIYLYFRDHLVFFTPGAGGKDISSYTKSQLRKSCDEGYKTKLTNFLAAVDTGIDTVELEINRSALGVLNKYPDRVAETPTRPSDSDSFYKPVFYRTVFDGHEESGVVPFDLEEESAGTVKLYALAGRLIAVLESGGTLVVDELDNSLHPHISEYIIELFNTPGKNPKNAQLIAATHDATLLNPDILRRDQVWFIRKNKTGATEVYSLDEFDKNEVRKNTAFDKWYLEGRFGAIPFIIKKNFHLNEA